MRAIWKGAVSFGLVNVPVRLYSATENHDVQFRQVHVADGGRIRYKRVCSIDGDEVAYDDIAKGYETEDGEMVVLTDEDFADLPTRSSKEISVEKFVPSDQIDPIYFDKTYYLEPDKSAVKPYVLLRDALEGEDRMAVATVAIRTRMTLAVLRVREGMIVMQTMLWPDEVRDAGAFGDLGADEKATEKEMSMAQVLIDQLADDFEPDDYEDDYALAVKELVRAKVEGGEVKAAPEEEDEGGEVVDLLAALAKSVERAKTRRGESSSATSTDDGSKGSSESGVKGSGAKKTTAKKTTAKKSAAKKAPAKKTAAKTTTSKSTAKKPAPKKKAG
ncbi:Ku protein [Janibacter melonis]|uniref:non-homologous end joining protein Ku n=1 Tax=Janibacter melonis TaxID=262209 RepID=UPI00191981D3|nr:Ku protein [Janibacter melonis]